MPLDIQSTLTNPGGRFELTAHRDPFPTEAFDSDEASLFQDQLNTLVAEIPNSVITSVLEQRQATLGRVAALAKAEFDGKTFGGVNAGDNEIGFSILRPGQILETGSSAIITEPDDWYASPSGTGWVDWIGDGNNNKTIGTGANEQVLVVLAMMDQEPGPTDISGINVESFGRNMDMLPRDINDARLQDNETNQQVVPLPGLVARENDEVHIKLRFDRDVERQPRLLGFNFALGTYLDDEDYDT